MRTIWQLNLISPTWPTRLICVYVYLSIILIPIKKSKGFYTHKFQHVTLAYYSLVNWQCPTQSQLTVTKTHLLFLSLRLINHHLLQAPPLTSYGGGSRRKYIPNSQNCEMQKQKKDMRQRQKQQHNTIFVWFGNLLTSIKLHKFHYSQGFHYSLSLKKLSY